MSGRCGDDLLALPVVLNGIALARPVDLLFDPEARRALGLVVRCRDEAHRFLAFGAATVGEDSIEVESALALVDELAFYLRRGTELRTLRHARVERAGVPVGTLQDLVLGAGGRVTELAVATEAGLVRVPFDGTVELVPTRRITAA
jgi:hypothetical protein